MDISSDSSGSLQCHWTPWRRWWRPGGSLDGQHGGAYPSDVLRSGQPTGWTCLASKNDGLPSGKHTKSCGKSPDLIGKLSTNGPFSIAMLIYWRVTWLVYSSLQHQRSFYTS